MHQSSEASAASPRGRARRRAIRGGLFSVATLLSAAVALSPGAARAEGETNYDPLVCGGPHGSPRPEFSTAVDLPYIVAKIQEYSLDPGKLYGPDDPWTNWYRETDMRNALAKLATMRNILEKFNLWDTYRFGGPEGKDCPAEALFTRQVDGTCNDMEVSWMGAAGARFGRNMDPTGEAAQSEAGTEAFLAPNPRDVSRELFTRDTFKEVPFLNMLAGVWPQFQVHDWFSHKTTKHEFWEVPLAADDPLARGGSTVMRVPKTAPDTSRGPHEAAMGPTYPNEVTHWWDASQVYGSDPETAGRLRSFEGGKLRIGEDGLLPKADDGFEETGFRQNWWLGLGLLHNLFAQEHNAIADMLAKTYPWMTDQELYDKARMINAAVIVKIHTLEWTTAILPNPTLEVGMNANWAGLNQYMNPPLPEPDPLLPVPNRNAVFGIRGGPRELHSDPETGKDVPFAMTEEFVSAYRMHSLLPDAFEIASLDGTSLDSVPLGGVLREDARKIEEEHGLENLLYSFGVSHPGALVLNNHPAALQALNIPRLGKLDLGTVDVLRDRERGVPRFNEFRRQLNLMPLDSIDELTPDPVLRRKLKDVYGHDADAIERVDFLVGSLAEGTRPTCYGFGETIFQTFIVIASRRLHADRFFTEAYNADSYTQAGLDWIEASSLKEVLLRHYPELASTGLANVTNAFYPWE